MASNRGHIEVVRLLLEARADGGGDELPSTALLEAAVEWHLEVACLLLQPRAHTDWGDIDGVTALTAAAAHGHGDIVRLLLEAKADKDCLDTEIAYLSSQVGAGRSPV